MRQFWNTAAEGLIFLGVFFFILWRHWNDGIGCKTVTICAEGNICFTSLLALRLNSKTLFMPRQSYLPPNTPWRGCKLSDPPCNYEGCPSAADDSWNSLVALLKWRSEIFFFFLLFATELPGDDTNTKVYSRWKTLVRIEPLQPIVCLRRCYPVISRVCQPDTIELGHNVCVACEWEAANVLDVLCSTGSALQRLYTTNSDHIT